MTFRRPTGGWRQGAALPTVHTSAFESFGEAEDHYEETNSAGWDLEADILAAVGALTGSNDPTVVNPDFAGWWIGHVPE